MARFAKVEQKSALPDNADPETLPIADRRSYCGQISQCTNRHPIRLAEVIQRALHQNY